MKRRDIVRHAAALAGGTMGAGALAACGIGGGQPAATTVERATIRTLTRAAYEPDAWKLVSTDEQAKVTVEVEQSDTGTDPAQYGRKILTLAAGDSLPDVYYVHPNYFSSVASRKLLIDHDKVANQQKFDLKGIQKELIDSNRWTDGKLYAIPYSGVSYLLIVNNGLFRQRGVPVPAELEKQGKWNWDGFRDALRRLTNRNLEEPVLGMPEHLRGLQYLSHWIMGNGGEVFSKDMQTCLLDSPKTREALEYVAELHAKDQLTPQAGEAELFGATTSQRGFESGRMGVYFRATTEVAQLKPMADRGAQLAVAPVPRGPVARTPRGAGNAWGIATSSKHPEAAFRGIAAWHRDPVLDHLYKQRAMFPARATQFDHPSFKTSLYAWEDLEVERTALQEVRIMATPDRFTELDQQWNRMWADAIYGKRTVREMLQDFVPQANALLRG